MSATPSNVVGDQRRSRDVIYKWPPIFKMNPFCGIITWNEIVKRLALTENTPKCYLSQSGPDSSQSRLLLIRFRFNDHPLGYDGAVLAKNLAPHSPIMRRFLRCATRYIYSDISLDLGWLYRGRTGVENLRGWVRAKQGTRSMPLIACEIDALVLALLAEILGMPEMQFWALQQFGQWLYPKLPLPPDLTNLSWHRTYQGNTPILVASARDLHQWSIFAGTHCGWLSIMCAQQLAAKTQIRRGLIIPLNWRYYGGFHVCTPFEPQFGIVVRKDWDERLCAFRYDNIYHPYPDNRHNELKPDPYSAAYRRIQSIQTMEEKVVDACAEMEARWRWREISGLGYQMRMPQIPLAVEAYPNSFTLWTYPLWWNYVGVLSDDSLRFF